MGVPPEMTVYFHNVEDTARALPTYQTDRRSGIVLVGDIGTMSRLVDASHGSIKQVNVGGVHHAPGRTGHLRYVFLTVAEEEGLRAIARAGVSVTAQDVPSARAVSLEELLSANPDA